MNVINASLSNSLAEIDYRNSILFERFRIHHMPHDNAIHLEVHKPAFSIHFYRPRARARAVMLLFGFRICSSSR